MLQIFPGGELFCGKEHRRSSGDLTFEPNKSTSDKVNQSSKSGPASPWRGRGGAGIPVTPLVFLASRRRPGRAPARQKEKNSETLFEAPRGPAGEDGVGLAAGGPPQAKPCFLGQLSLSKPSLPFRSSWRSSSLPSALPSSLLLVSARTSLGWDG